MAIVRATETLCPSSPRPSCRHDTPWNVADRLVHGWSHTREEPMANQAILRVVGRGERGFGGSWWEVVC